MNLLLYSRNAARHISILVLIGLLIVMTATVIFSPQRVYAGGPIHGARAAGMGTAFIGVADDPSAILHNPGGLAQVRGTRVYGGLSALTIHSEFVDPQGREEETEFRIFTVPHGYVTSDLGFETLIFGIGVYSPFGIGGREWKKTGLTRYLSTKDMIGTVSVNPTVAWQALPWLSVAAGIDYMHAFVENERRLDQSMVLYGDARSRTEADGGGWGYNLGLLINVGNRIRVGLAYRSKIEVDFDGDLEIENIAPGLQPLFGGAEFKSNVGTSSTFPDIIGGGISWMPTEKLLLDFDLEVVRWSSFDRQFLNVKREVPEAGIFDKTVPQDWDDSWQLKFGSEYRVSENFALRGGYAFIGQSVPEHTLGPGNPDANQHNFSVGLGYRTGRWTIDAFYNAGFFEDRSISNSIITGEFDSQTHAIGSSIGYRF